MPSIRYWMKVCLFVLLLSLVATESWFAQELSSARLPEKSSFLDVSFRKGKTFIDDIRADEIRIENGEGNQITAIESIGEMPLCVALLIDVSGSQKLSFSRVSYPWLAEAIRSLPLRNVDAACLIGFNESAFVRQDFTFDKTLLLKSIDSIRFAGGTRLFDALFITGKSLGDRQNCRKAMIVFTDGEDTSSRGTIENAYSEAVANNVRIYMLLDEKAAANTFLRQGSRDYSSMHKKYAARTGGRTLSSSGPQSMRANIDNIFDELSHLKRVFISSPGKRTADLKLSVLRKGVKAYYPSALK